MPRSTLDKKFKQYAASGVTVPPAQNGGFRAARWSSQGDRASGEVSNRVADSDSAGEILTASDSKAKFKCRCCGVSVEADAGRCHRCGVAHPTSDFRAVVLSPTAIPFYVVMVLSFITVGRFRTPQKFWAAMGSGRVKTSRGRSKVHRDYSSGYSVRTRRSGVRGRLLLSPACENSVGSWEILSMSSIAGPGEAPGV